MYKIHDIYLLDTLGNAVYLKQKKKKKKRKKEETDLCSEMNLNSSNSLLSHLHTRTYIQYITYKIYYMYISTYT